MSLLKLNKCVRINLIHQWIVYIEFQTFTQYHLLPYDGYRLIPKCIADQCSILAHYACSIKWTNLNNTVYQYIDHPMSFLICPSPHRTDLKINWNLNIKKNCLAHFSNSILNFAPENCVTGWKCLISGLGSLPIVAFVLLVDWANDQRTIGMECCAASTCLNILKNKSTHKIH